MSSERSGKSHTVIWTILILLVPILYFLSVPLLFNIVAINSLGWAEGPPETSWVRVYEKPYRYVCRETALRKVLWPYEAWVTRQFMPGPFQSKDSAPASTHDPFRD